jgi:hypothetical protein
MKINPKAKPTLLLVYDNEFKLIQAIFAPTQGQAYNKMNLDNREFISPIINGFIAVSKKVDSNINCPLPISFPNYDDFAIRAFDIDGAFLWKEHIEKELKSDIIIKEEKERVAALIKIEEETKREQLIQEREELQRQKQIQVDRRKQLRENRKKGNRQAVHNEYNAIFAYIDTGEVYKEYKADTTKMIGRLIGLNKSTVRRYYNNATILKYNKIKHIQAAIEKRGLSLIIYPSRIKDES